MNVDKLRVLFISDIHLFHPKTVTSKIVEELKYYFDDSLNVDIVYIGGDFFDRLSSLPKDIAVDAHDCIYYLLKWCKKTDTQLRVLEGTPSHDWRQSKWFITINTLSGINADVEYIPDLSIEYNERYDIYTLYVPDEWNSDTSVTLNEVKTLLKNKGIEKVDLSIMHGQFHYQLPEIAKAPKHDENEYLNLTRYYISIGHVHRHSTYDRIIAQGSFSRLIHGEEEAKGFVIATIYKSGDMMYEFVENTLATKYIDIDLTNVSIEDSNALIASKIKGLPEFSYIRLITLDTHPYAKNLDTIIRQYSNYKFSPIKVISTKVEDNTPVESFSNYNVVQITKDNLSTLLLNRLSEKGIDKEDIELAQSILQEIDNAIT